jgi:hypothetical protein
VRYYSLWFVEGKKMNWTPRFLSATMIGLVASAAALFGGALLAPALAQDAYQSIGNIVTCGTTAACVAGTNSAKGPGVQGISTKGDGVVGQTKFKSTVSLSHSGILGQDLSTSIYGAGVRGTSTTGTGVYASSSSGAAVVGRSTSAAGVLGQSTPANGVTATSVSSDGILSVTGFGGGASTAHSGVAGFDNSTSGGTNYGVFGGSTSGIGVAGGSPDGYGVQATSINGDGLFAWSENLTGVVGYTGYNGGSPGGSSGVFGGDLSSDGMVNFGVAAESVHSVGLVSFNDYANTNFAIEAFGGTTDSSGGNIAGFDAYGNRVLAVDNVGNVFISGAIYTQGACYNGCAKTHGAGKNVVSYTPRETLPTMEDFGQAQLVDGTANVEVDRAFANVIDHGSTYLVFLTPEGDTRGLYVTNKTLKGFTVRENQGGSSSVSFSYRIVAKPYGSNERRLPMMQTIKASRPDVASHFKKLKKH